MLETKVQVYLQYKKYIRALNSKIKWAQRHIEKPDETTIRFRKYLEAIAL